MRPRRLRRQPEGGSTTRELSLVLSEQLLRPPFAPRLAAKELRAKARASHKVVISADFALAIAQALDPEPACP